MLNVFVIRPFNKKQNNSGVPIDFTQVHEELIEPAVKKAGLTVRTTLNIDEAGNIQEDMFRLLIEADLVICDITIHNPNVFYELGIRHALRKKYNILIKQEQVGDQTPFDLGTERYLHYHMDTLAEDQKKLTTVIESTLHSSRGTDSPVFHFLSTLKEADPSTVQLLPPDFQEEVERALEAGSKGLLRLLAQELVDYNRRFQWMGLQLIAIAQWQLKDYKDARKHLEDVRESHWGNVATDLALANIYERLYRDEGKLEILTSSEQAIKRVLDRKDITVQNRAEARALQGRNQKTRWRHGFENLPSVEERRRAAMSGGALHACYEAYRNAFYEDLNHFYSGINALQMGTTFLDLSKGDNHQWWYSFDKKDRAEAERQKITEEVKNLKLLVSTSIDVMLNESNRTHSERVWAEISKADLMFLEEQAEQNKQDIVINKYKDIFQKNESFYWDATKRQLQLFADLGIEPDLANAVIATIDNPQKPAEDKPVHIILFAGHRVDAPGRVKPRFPAQQEDHARQLIREALRGKLNPDYQLIGLASAAPGADILFHEVCNELSVPSVLCLPVQAEDYARLAFRNLDGWRSRFIKLLHERKEKQGVLELSDREELPDWLHDAQTNFWERGNRWIVQMALTWKAQKAITLIALWDHKNKGDGPGGTAHIVQVTRNIGAGKIHSEIIDAGLLLK